METLEITVFDNISTFDTLVEAVKFVEEIIRKWISTQDDKPLIISMRKNVGRSPPILNINVVDTVKGESGLV